MHRSVLAVFCMFGIALLHPSSADARERTSAHVSGRAHANGHPAAASSRRHSEKRSKTPKALKPAKHPKPQSAPHAAHASGRPFRSNRCDNCDRDAHGRIVRSGEAKGAFKHATGYPHGRPGYVIDHINPLACGGRDVPSNMQWQTIADAKAKDKHERAGCR
jgi:hypothetical protein